MSFRETESQKHPEILERIYHKIFEFLNKILKRNELLFIILLFFILLLRILARTFSMLRYLVEILFLRKLQ